MAWKQWDAVVSHQKYESRTEVSSPTLDRPVLTSLQADSREIPDDPKTIWGFDGADVEHAAVRARKNTHWLATLENLREECPVTESFTAFCCKTMESEVNVIQQILRWHEPSSTLLELSLRDSMTKKEGKVLPLFINPLTSANTGSTFGLPPCGSKGLALPASMDTLSPVPALVRSTRIWTRTWPSGIRQRVATGNAICSKRRKDAAL